MASTLGLRFIKAADGDAAAGAELDARYHLLLDWHARRALLDGQPITVVAALPLNAPINPRMHLDLYHETLDAARRWLLAAPPAVRTAAVDAQLGGVWGATLVAKDPADNVGVFDVRIAPAGMAALEADVPVHVTMDPGTVRANLPVYTLNRFTLYRVA